MSADTDDPQTAHWALKEGGTTFLAGVAGTSGWRKVNGEVGSGQKEEGLGERWGIPLGICYQVAKYKLGCDSRCRTLMKGCSS